MNLVFNFWVTIYGTFHKVNMMALGPGSATKCISTSKKRDSLERSYKIIEQVKEQESGSAG